MTASTLTEKDVVAADAVVAVEVPADAYVVYYLLPVLSYSY